MASVSAFEPSIGSRGASTSTRLAAAAGTRALLSSNPTERLPPIWNGFAVPWTEEVPGLGASPKETRAARGGGGIMLLSRRLPPSTPTPAEAEAPIRGGLASAAGVAAEAAAWRPVHCFHCCVNVPITDKPAPPSSSGVVSAEAQLAESRSPCTREPGEPLPQAGADGATAAFIFSATFATSSRATVQNSSRMVSCCLSRLARP